jgi:hypothetical protein
MCSSTVYLLLHISDETFEGCQMRKMRLALKDFRLFRDLQEPEIERDEWVFENLTKEHLKSSGVIQ